MSEFFKKPKIKLRSFLFLFLAAIAVFVGVMAYSGFVFAAIDFSKYVDMANDALKLLEKTAGLNNPSSGFKINGSFYGGSIIIFRDVPYTGSLKNTVAKDCKYISYYNTKNVLIPTRSDEEWDYFIKNANSAGLDVADCEFVNKGEDKVDDQEVGREMCSTPPVYEGDQMVSGGEPYDCGPSYITSTAGADTCNNDITGPKYECPANRYNFSCNDWWRVSKRPSGDTYSLRKVTCNINGQLPPVKQAKVIKNEGSGKSCAELCNASNLLACTDVGTDVNATNKDYLFGQALNNPVTCDSAYGYNRTSANCDSKMDNSHYSASCKLISSNKLFRDNKTNLSATGCRCGNP